MGVNVLDGIYINIICMSTIVYGKTIQKNRMLKCVGGIMYSKHVHAQSQFLEFETKCRLELPLGILNTTFIRPVKTDL